MRVLLAAILVLAATAASAGAGTPERIVFSATDAPFADDVMVVHADGTQTDLSKSPALDTAPVLSHDGKLVAFFSARGGRGAEYVVRIDGTGLRRISPSLATPPDVSWSSNDVDLALFVGPGQGRPAVFRASARGGVWARVDHGGAQSLVGWSQAAARLAYVTALDDVVVVGRTGKKAFTANGEQARWSPSGRLAVQRDSRTWQVYDPAGKRLASVPATVVAWSPQGKLASLTPAGVLQIRPGGTGAPTASARPVRHPSALIWVGPAHVLVAGEDGFVGYDVTHRATFVLAAAFRLNPSVSTAGVAFGEVGSGTLVRSTLSGSTRTLASVPACGGKDADPFFDLQALPDGSGAVYAADCALPHDLFSIAPDGSGLSRLTDTPQDELGPALSPDGTRVAFSRTDTALCECDEQIWITSLDGSDPRSVPLPSDSGLHQDEHPSFSPDGTRLVFSRWDPAVTGDTARLAEASAAGGAATLLKPSGGNPAWGPSRIAFNAADVETVAPDGTDAAVVPNTSLAEGGPAAWSADGRLAVLRVSTFSIYFPAAKTSIRLPGLHEAIGPAPGLAWSPDGTRLAFTGADANGVDDVWTVRVDGTGLTRVTHDLDADGAIAWR